MKPKTVMLLAGEASGDLLAAELVRALRQELAAADVDYSPDLQPLRTGLEPRFFGAGGPRMKAAGVELAFDLTRHSVVGLSDVLRNYFKFRRLFHRLLALALDREPDVIVGVDFGAFNLRFARAIRRRTASRDWFHDWRPTIVQYVSPQVWASREGRAAQMARDCDLLLSIFPFEQEWYARRAPKLRVEFVGHPMVGRFAKAGGRGQKAKASAAAQEILLLPGSRIGELRRHLPVMIEAARIIRSRCQVKFKMVLPDAELCAVAQGMAQTTVKRELTETTFNLDSHPFIKGQVGNLPDALAQADVAIASTGTVTMECAFFGVPAITLYKTSWINYPIAKPLVKVKWLTMPNLLANEALFPEFIQHDATAENISRAALELLADAARQNVIREKLARIVASLGPPGASRRAAAAIVRCLESERVPTA